MKLYLWNGRDEGYKAIVTQKETINRANDYLQAYYSKGFFKEYLEGSDVDGITFIETFTQAIKLLNCIGISIQKLTIDGDEDATIEKLAQIGYMEV